MLIRVVIRRQSGKPVKSFDFRGPRGLEEPLLWIWRDLFVSLITYGSQSSKDKIPEMLEDIASSIGWNSLERLLYGGKGSKRHLLIRLTLFTLLTLRSRFR
jgi:hypothetical protein